jgi:hypothetical protein
MKARWWKWVVVSLVLFVVGLTAAAYFAMRPVPLGAAPDIASRMRTIAELRAVEGEDARPLYLEAVALYDGLRRLDPAPPSASWWRREWNQDWRDAALHSLELGSWDDPRHEPAKAFFESYRPVVEATVRAAAAPAMRWAEFDALLAARPGSELSRELGAREPSFPELSRLEDLVAIALREAIAEGRPGDAATLLRTGFAIADHKVMLHDLWPSAVSSVAVESGMLGVVRQSAMSGELRDAATIEALEAVIADRPPYRLDREAATLAFEAWMLNELWGLRVSAYGLHWWERAQLLWDHLSGRNQYLYSGMISDMAAWSERVRWERVERAAGEIATEVGRWWSGDWSADPPAVAMAHADALPTDYADIVSLFSVPTLPTLESARAATLVVLAMTRHRIAEGAWPAALAECVPDPLLVDPVSGVAWEYRRNNDGSFALQSTIEDAMLPERRLSRRDSSRDMARPRRDATGSTPWLRDPE